MRNSRWLLSLSLLWAFSLGLVGCATSGVGNAPSSAHAAVSVSAEVQNTLAPTGVFRVAVYPGSPTSLVTNPHTGQRAGVALELGQALGRQLGVPVQIVEFARVAQVLDALKAGQVDFTFTNATEARARDVNFSAPLVRLELGLLVPPQSPIAQVSEVDRAGVRVGVSSGSSSQGVLSRLYKQAQVVPADSLAQAQALLRGGQIDAFATNKGILFEMSDALPQYKVLAGRWGFENLAIAIPKGREAAMPFVRDFADQVRGQTLDGIVARSGLRGTAKADERP
jgi:polar amino acid transport system substrate-binding protein